MRHIIHDEGIGKLTDTHREKQGHRHHAEAFGKEETEGAPCTRPHTLADSQLALTVVEHLDDELQEVHNARNQDQGGNEVAHRLYPNVSFVTTQRRVGHQRRILISRVELDLPQTFVQPMDIHTRLQYRFYIQCLSIECRQRKIDVRILQIPVDGKESIHYTHDAVKLDFPFLSRNPMQGHSQWVFLAECPTGKVTADNHFVLFQHTGVTTHTLHCKIGERTPIGLFVMGHIRHLTSVAVDDSYFRLRRIIGSCRQAIQFGERNVLQQLPILQSHPPHFLLDMNTSFIIGLVTIESHTGYVHTHHRKKSDANRQTKHRNQAMCAILPQVAQSDFQIVQNHVQRYI